MISNSITPNLLKLVSELALFFNISAVLSMMYYFTGIKESKLVFALALIVNNSALLSEISFLIGAN